jgi:hypothetical protein
MRRIINQMIDSEHFYFYFMFWLLKVLMVELKNIKEQISEFLISNECENIKIFILYEKYISP